MFSFLIERFKYLSKEEIDCPIACRVVDFDTIISYSKYPSNKEADRLARNMFQLKDIGPDSRRFIR